MSNINLNLAQDKMLFVVVRQGYENSFNFQWFQSDSTTPQDLTGLTFFAQIRKDYADASAIVISELTTTVNASGDKLTVTANIGLIDVFIGQTTSRSLKADENYFFEIQIKNAGKTIDGVKCFLNVEPEIARAN